MPSMTEAEPTGREPIEAAPIEVAPTRAGRAARSSKRPRNRLAVRARLALTYAALVTVAGVVLLVIVSVVVGLLPSYSFSDAIPLPTESSAAEVLEPAETMETGPIGPDELEYGVYVDASLLAPTSLAVTVSSRSDMLQLLLAVSGIALAVLAVGGACAGWIISGRMLRPLQYVNAAAHRAAAGHLDHRIKLDGPRDEITELADTFDHMLDVIERSVESHRRFAANASHELRTPLTTNKVMIDVALNSLDARAGQSGETVDAALSEEKQLLLRLRETNERSIQTVESLLDLAEIEAGASLIETVALDHLAEEVLGESLAETIEAGVSLSSTLEPVTVEGDAALLRQLLSNLVQNAIRHNEPGGDAMLRIANEGDDAVIEVSNSGAVVSADVAGRLADPFYRGSGRTNAASARGRGLGLSIVSAIVNRHEGSLVVEAREQGGLTVRVVLPASRG